MWSPRRAFAQDVASGIESTMRPQNVRFIAVVRTSGTLFPQTMRMQYRRHCVSGRSFTKVLMASRAELRRSQLGKNLESLATRCVSFIGEASKFTPHIVKKNSKTCHAIVGVVVRKVIQMRRGVNERIDIWAQFLACVR